MSAFLNKRVLVTGGAGFIGSNLAIRLVAEGAKVSVIDCLIPDLGGNMFNLAPVRESIKFELWDLRDGAAVARLVRDYDYIFNLAGNISHSDSMSNPLQDTTINMIAQLNILEGCRHENPGAVIVYSGTRQVYGAPKYLPVDESHPLQPLDVNGINKLAAEQAHLLYAKVYGMKAVSLRLTNTYGPRQLIKHSRQGFIAWFVNRALTGNTIELYGGGQQQRDLTYVDDVVEALLLAATHTACYGQIYNLSGDKASLDQIARRLIELTGKGRIKTIPFPPEAKKIDIGDYTGNSQKFNAATKWTPKTALNDGLRLMIDYYKPTLAHYLEG